MLQIQVKDQYGEWSEFISDSPMEALNELIDIVRREGAIAALEWAEMPEAKEF